MLPTLISIIITIASSNPAKIAGELFVPQAISSHVMPMNDRYGNEFVNNVFRDNILLTLHYMNGDIKSKADIDWDKVNSPFSFEFTLSPGQRFAFHDKILKEYKDNVVKTMNAHFNYTDGFKSDGYLTGDGVCHLASIVYWVAKDANLDTYAPANHDFAKIPDVPKEYGVAIYASPTGGGEMQNLYIRNNKDKNITFSFNYDGTNLTVSVKD